MKSPHEKALGKKSPYGMGRFASSMKIVPIEEDKAAQKKMGITKKHLAAKKKW